MHLPDPPLVQASPVVAQRLSVKRLHGQLGRGLQFVVESLKLGVRRPVLLGPVVLAALLQVAVWVFVLWIFITHDVRQSTTMEAVLTLAAMYVSTLIQTVARATLSHLSACYVRGLPLRLGQAGAHVAEAIKPLLGLAAIGSVLRFMARSSGSSAMVRAWDAGSFLLVPVVVLEERSLSEGLDRAKALKSDKLQIGTVSVAAATGLIGMLLLAPWLALFIYTIRQGPIYPVELLQWLAAGAGLWALSNIVGSLANSLYSTCVYLVSREIEREPEAPEVRVPDLLANVLPPYNPDEPPPPEEDTDS